MRVALFFLDRCFGGAILIGRGTNHLQERSIYSEVAMNAVRSVVGVVVVLLLTAASAQGEENWAGKKVILKKGDCKVVDTDNNGKTVEVGEIRVAVVVVLSEKGGRIR